MTPVAAFSMDLLWHNALGAIPLAIVVMVICRFVRCRPSTRHVLWLIVLLSLLAPPLVPALDFSDDLGSPQFFAVIRESHAKPQADSNDQRRTSAQPRPQQKASTSERNSRTQRAAPAPLLQADKPVFDQPEPFSYWTQTSLTPESAASTASEGSPDMLSRPASHPASSAAAPSDSSTIRPEAPPRSTPITANGHTDTRPVISNVPREPASIAQADSGELPIPAVASEAPKTSASPAIIALNTAIEWRDWLVRVAAARDSIVSLAPIPVSLWAIGVGGIMLVMFVRIVRFRTLLRRALPATDEVVEMVRRNAESIGLRSVPRVLVTHRQVSPLVWCGVHRVLLLPEPLWNDLDEIGRRAVLLHELAHLKRRDHLVCWIEVIACTIYWWNPMAWWVRHRLRDEADYCCDAWVTAVLPGSRTAYARALLTTRQYLNVNPSRTDTPSLALGATSARTKRFARRLTMVMTERSAPRLSMCGSVLALMLAGGVWLATPLWACPPEESAGGPSAQAAAKAEKAEKAAAAKAGKTTAATAANAEKAAKEKAVKAAEEAHAHAQVHVPHVVVTPQGQVHVAEVAPEGSTFEQHMAGRSAPSGTIAQVAPRTARAISVAPRAGQGGGDLENRINRLEERMDRLTAHLEALLGGGSKGAPGGATGMGGAHAGPRLAQPTQPPAPPQPPQAPRARQPRTPVPPAPPSAPRAAVPGGAGIGGGLARTDPEPADAGEQIVRFYELPQDKAAALFEFMRRDDVPVMVAQRDNGIEVHGTAQQHRIFAAFVKLIHPEAKIEGMESLAPAQGMGGRERELAAREREVAAAARERATDARARAQAQRTHAQGQVREVRAQLERARKAQADHFKHAAEAQRKQIEQERQEIEKQREQMKKQVEDLLRKSGELQKKAEQLRAKAESLDDGADKEQLQAQADAVEAEAQSLEDQAVAQDEASEAHLEAITDELESRMEAMEESFEAQMEAMDSELEAQMEAMESDLEAQMEAMEAELEAQMQTLEVEAAKLPPAPAGVPTEPAAPAAPRP